MSEDLRRKVTSSKNFILLNAICLPVAIFKDEVLLDCNVSFERAFPRICNTDIPITYGYFISHFERFKTDSDDYLDVFELNSGEFYRLNWGKFADTQISYDLLLIENSTRIHSSLRRNLDLQRDLLQTSKNLSVGEITTTLAHELNQPIGSIYNFLSAALYILKAEPESVAPRAISALNEALMQTEHCAAVIKGIREFVSRKEPHRKPCEAANLLEHVVELVKPDLLANKVKLIVETEANLPPVNADQVLIEQVLSNLIRNGTEAMRLCSPLAKQLIVSVQQIDTSVQFSIADRGSGVPEDSRDKIFSPFFTTKENGMGVGLAICRSVVEFHQGRLYFEPNTHGGATFRFTLPIAETSAQSDQPHIVVNKQMAAL